MLPALGLLVLGIFYFQLLYERAITDTSNLIFVLKSPFNDAFYRKQFVAVLKKQSFQAFLMCLIS